MRCAAARPALAGALPPALPRHLPRPVSNLQEPEVSITTPGTYTLLLVDPDSPSPHSPKYRCWLHWMVRAQCRALGGAGGLHWH